MDRRRFLAIVSAALTGAARVRVAQARTAPPGGRRVAVTMDDFSVLDEAGMPVAERAARILDALRRHDSVAMGLVVGRGAGNPQISAVLDRWSAAGHVIGNHTFSHPDFHAPGMSAAAFVDDFVRGDTVLKTRRGFQRYFRFPMLHGGDTAAKRDAMRTALARHDYREAHVTIDTSDWLIDRELRARLAANPKLDTRPYGEIYVRHMRAFASYFHDAALTVFGGEIPHTLLTHFNLVSALYLGELLDALKTDGWSIVAATDAYADEVFRRTPHVLPAGDSLVVACAREDGKHMPKAPLEDDGWLEREFARLRG